MKYFVFRNNTLEIFFNKDYAFSGYDDISYVPEDAENLVWFYQVPVKYDSAMLAAEVKSFCEKLKLVYNQIPKNKNFIIISLFDLYSVSFSDSDFLLVDAVVKFNSFAKELTVSNSNVKFIDFSEFASGYKKSELVDWKFYFTSQILLNPKIAGAFRSWWNKKLDNISLKRKKCLCLDLDNTLWGGILGEDGIEGIKIGGDYPGKAFLYFQEAIAELSKQGVILTICSKNNEADVLECWEKNPFVVLRKDYISAYRINWSNKASNIKELAEELNIGLDSFVFVDDNPTERELVKGMLPMVTVPDFPSQAYELPSFFKSLVKNYFQIYEVTDEDKNKTEQYKANAARKQEELKFSDYSDYLKSLNIEITIEAANEFNITRIAQMTQKTNQFNLTTRRYSDADIRKILDDGGKIWCISVKDKFGDNGITGAIIIKDDYIDSLFLSCRILGKNIEKAFVKTILSVLKEDGTKIIKAEYIPTQKNMQVADFYDKCGFTLISEKDRNKKYELKLAEYNCSVDDLYSIVIKK
ncbi:HAD family hydrolase [uncultured Treponema sp.]|uniref:HAD-IIIC family phosphatase n=1 Tax=uncultured Treponema sp. TaxID=162155 RepID=UPI002637E83C|nr:HAD-IIIC family phosphatase [uncultured Treponema sp.]